MVSREKAGGKRKGKHYLSFTEKSFRRKEGKTTNQQKKPTKTRKKKKKKGKRRGSGCGSFVVKVLGPPR